MQLVQRQSLNWKNSQTSFKWFEYSLIFFVAANFIRYSLSERTLISNVAGVVDIGIVQLSLRSADKCWGKLGQICCQECEPTMRYEFHLAFSVGSRAIWHWSSDLTSQLLLTIHCCVGSLAHWVVSSLLACQFASLSASNEDPLTIFCITSKVFHLIVLQSSLLL